MEKLVFQEIKVCGIEVHESLINRSSFRERLVVSRPLKEEHPQIYNGSGAEKRMYEMTIPIRGFNTIILPLINVKKIQYEDIEKLVEIINARTQKFEIAVQKSAQFGTCGPRKHKLCITVPAVLVSYVLNELTYVNFFETDKFIMSEYTSDMRSLAAGCFINKQEQDLGKINRLFTNLFSILIVEDVQSPRKLMQVDLNALNFLFGMYDNLTWNYPQDLKKELAAVCDSTEFEIADESTSSERGSLPISSSLLCDSFIPGIEFVQLDKVLASLSTLKKDLEVKYPEQKKHPKLALATALLGVSCGVATGFMAYDAYKAYQSGNMPELAKKKSLWASLFGAFFGSLGGCAVWLNSFKHRIFKGDTDQKLYENFDSLQRLYADRLAYIHYNQTSFVEFTFWQQEATLMKIIFEQKRSDQSES